MPVSIKCLEDAILDYYTHPELGIISKFIKAEYHIGQLEKFVKQIKETKSDSENSKEYLTSDEEQTLLKFLIEEKTIQGHVSNEIMFNLKLKVGMTEKIQSFIKKGKGNIHINKDTLLKKHGNKKNKTYLDVLISRPDIVDFIFNHYNKEIVTELEIEMVENAFNILDSEKMNGNVRIAVNHFNWEELVFLLKHQKRVMDFIDVCIASSVYSDNNFSERKQIELEKSDIYFVCNLDEISYQYLKAILQKYKHYILQNPDIKASLFNVKQISHYAHLSKIESYKTINRTRYPITKSEILYFFNHPTYDQNEIEAACILIVYDLLEDYSSLIDEFPHQAKNAVLLLVELLRTNKDKATIQQYIHQIMLNYANKTDEIINVISLLRTINFNKNMYDILLSRLLEGKNDDLISIISIIAIVNEDKLELTEGLNVFLERNKKNMANISECFRLIKLLENTYDTGNGIKNNLNNVIQNIEHSPFIHSTLKRLQKFLFDIYFQKYIFSVNQDPYPKVSKLIEIVLRHPQHENVVSALMNLKILKQFAYNNHILKSNDLSEEEIKAIEENALYSDQIGFAFLLLVNNEENNTTSTNYIGDFFKDENLKHVFLAGKYAVGMMLYIIKSIEILEGDSYIEQYGYNKHIARALTHLGAYYNRELINEFFEKGFIKQLAIAGDKAIFLGPPLIALINAKKATKENVEKVCKDPLSAFDESKALGGIFIKEPMTLNYINTHTKMKVLMSGFRGNTFFDSERPLPEVLIAKIASHTNQWNSDLDEIDEEWIAIKGLNYLN